ncbi:MAG: DUF2079 domain-containing protein [Chloroflexi bacterium]|nr:DUF2079 domain-containing protein [Chloroflexota bacterium]
MSPFTEFAMTIALALCASTIAAAAAARVHLPTTRISRRAANTIVLALMLAYIGIFGSLSILRHESFHSGGFDLGIFDQVTWNSLHGRLFENTIRFDAPSFLGQHFSPLLIALVPLYAIWSDPRMLLGVQTVFLAISVLPLYWFARERLGTAWAVLIALAFFLYPSIQYVNLFEFHEIALATPLLTFALYFCLHRRYKPLVVTLMLALLTKEEVAFIISAFGVYLFFAQRKRGLGFALVLFGVTYVVVVFQYIIPYFSGQAYDANYFVMDRYAYLGSSPGQIVLTALTQPGLIVQHLLVPLKVEFVLQLLIPLAFIPLAGGEVLALGLPTIGYLLVGDYTYQNSIRYQYTAPLIPIVFFALVIGLARRRMSQPRLKYASATLLVTATLLNYYFQSSGPLAIQFDPKQYALDARVTLGRQLLAQIPPDAIVMAEGNLVPHLSDRRYIYQAPDVYDLRPLEYLIADKSFEVGEPYKPIWSDILSSPYFETVAEQGDFLLKRRAPARIDHPTQFHFDERISLLGYTVESTLPIRRGGSLSVVLTWHADQAIRERYVTFVHVLDARNQVWAQDDYEPANGWFRTDRWNAGDTTPDRFILELPRDMPPSDYRITAGLYATTDQKNLTAQDAEGNALGSEPLLGILTVVE